MAQRFSHEELILVRLLDLSTLMPHYWSQLVLLAMQLFGPEEREQLNAMIFESGLFGLSV
jgi:hypothetical protein